METRINAVEELITTENPKIKELASLLRQLPDLEKGLCRVHYGKVNFAFLRIFEDLLLITLLQSSPAELLKVLNALQRISQVFINTMPVENTRFTSPILNDIVDFLPTILDDVISLKSMLNIKAVERGDDMSELFQSHEPWPEISEFKEVCWYPEAHS